MKQEKLANAELLAAKPSEGNNTITLAFVKKSTVECILMQRCSSLDGDDDKNQSFVNSLVTKVVDNLQISIKNIHIRYEDRLSDPGVSTDTYST